MSLPVVVEAPVGVDAVVWAGAERPAIERLLLESGAVLLRGLGLDGAGRFEALIEAVAGPTLEYRDRATPRTRVHGGIFTATDYSPKHRIALHNECAYAARLPLRIAFRCVRPAEQGGETLLADVRRVAERIPSEVRARFAARGVLYVRNFRPGPFGFTWQDAFQTQDAAEVDAYCREAEIEREWVSATHLRTRERRPALARHPRTGAVVWANHAVVLHASATGAAHRAILLRLFGEAGLPTNTFYGDGAPLEDATLDALRAAYREETVAVTWRAGDVLLVDNLLVAHGREPYVGSRELQVGMALPAAWRDLALSPEGAP